MVAERLLLKVRESAGVEKKRYSDAVIKRSKSQREVNDLLGRKSSWSSADVIRFVLLSYFMAFVPIFGTKI
jgi:sensitive to high expression protein 9